MVSPTVYRYVDAAGQVHYLHGKEWSSPDTGRQLSLYFSRRLNQRQALAQLPAGYQVVVSPLTGRPYARKAARELPDADDAQP